jgi:hypothetical protein
MNASSATHSSRPTAVTMAPSARDEALLPILVTAGTPACSDKVLTPLLWRKRIEGMSMFTNPARFSRRDVDQIAQEARLFG